MRFWCVLPLECYVTWPVRNAKGRYLLCSLSFLFLLLLCSDRSNAHSFITITVHFQTTGVLYNGLSFFSFNLVRCSFYATRLSVCYHKCMQKWKQIDSCVGVLAATLLVVASDKIIVLLISMSVEVPLNSIVVCLALSGGLSKSESSPVEAISLSPPTGQ